MSKDQPEIYFSENHVAEVAEQIRSATKQYDQLFNSLALQIFTEIVDLEDPVEAVASCRRWTDAAINFFTNHFPHSPKTDCRMGCSHCCYLPVLCPPAVVVDVAQHVVKTFLEDELLTLKNACSLYVEVDRRQHHKRKCPFLTEDNLCRIYDHRPLSCRSFTSQDSAMCKASVSVDKKVPQDPVRHRIFQAATSALASSAKKKGISYQQVPFIPSLSELL